MESDEEIAKIRLKKKKKKKKKKKNPHLSLRLVIDKMKIPLNEKLQLFFFFPTFHYLSPIDHLNKTRIQQLKLIF